MKNRVFASLVLLVLLTCGCAMSANAAGGTYNWTGFYAGLNLGAAINDSKFTLTPTGGFLDPTDPFLAPQIPSETDSADFGGAAFIGGGQIGYNYQTGCFIFGVETDFDYNGVDESHSRDLALPTAFFAAGNLIHTVTQTVDFLGTVRGRVGYTPADRFMVYGTGGLAYGDVSSHSNVLFTSSQALFSGSSSGVQTGWTAGGGAEYALSRCWTVKLEYLFVDLGSKTYTYGTVDGSFPTFAYTTQVDTSEHVVRVGLNYRF